MTPFHLSYGGATAANVSEALAHSDVRVDLLITVDPVSRRWSRSDNAGNVDEWVNVYATDHKDPDKHNGRGGDTAAGIGGRWGNWPDGKADTHLEAAANHNEFSSMMNGNNLNQRILGSNNACQCEKN